MAESRSTSGDQVFDLHADGASPEQPITSVESQSLIDAGGEILDQLHVVAQYLRGWERDYSELQRRIESGGLSIRPEHQRELALLNRLLPTHTDVEELIKWEARTADSTTKE
jgi:hypothetical protein